jgi:hypothetical protein
MPMLRFIKLGVLLLLLGGCVAPVLLMPSSGQVIWALLKPLVGFDPNTVNLWEQPAIKNRMTAFLGDQYQPVMQLVRTANELKQEGPLFYVVSRYTPVPEIADKAGLVWNKDTNQFAALLHKDGVSQILTEKLQTAVENRATAEVQKRLPAWPAELAPLAALAVPLAPEALQKPAQVLLQAPVAAPAANAPGTLPTPPPPPSASPSPVAAPTRAPITGPSSPLPGPVPP